VDIHGDHTVSRITHLFFLIKSLIDSSIALDIEPLLYPNFSIAIFLKLSSISSGISTLIQPISYILTIKYLSMKTYKYIREKV